MTYLNTYKLNIFISSLYKAVKTYKFKDIKASDEDVICLFNSIINRYPIGCITFVNDHLADGYKRCAILFKAAFIDEHNCNVYFDSLDNKFLITNKPNKYQIHINNLFSTTKVRKFFKENFDETDAEYSICEDNVDNCCLAIMDCDIPVFNVADSKVNLLDLRKILNRNLSDDTGLNLNLYTI